MEKQDCRDYPQLIAADKQIHSLTPSLQFSRHKKANNCVFIYDSLEGLQDNRPMLIKYEYPPLSHTCFLSPVCFIPLQALAGLMKRSWDLKVSALLVFHKGLRADFLLSYAADTMVHWIPRRAYLLLFLSVCLLAATVVEHTVHTCGRVGGWVSVQLCVYASPINMMCYLN